MKLKTVYVCSACAAESQKWIGRCPECEAWNTFVEDVIAEEKTAPGRTHRQVKPVEPVSLNKNLVQQSERMKTDMEEFNRVLGGGVVKGSVMLLSGEPGIGKSTLVLQLANAFATQNKKILYLSGEESSEQISLRARRLNIHSPNIHLVSENNLDILLSTLEQEKPDFFILDSVQTAYTDQLPSSPGSITQVRAAAELLIRFAKQNEIPCLLIGHVTKDGTIAGPRMLEHLVDSVMQLEGDRYQNLRLLRSVKNRFGSTNEVGVFEMNEKGMQEVKNPSALFLEGRAEHPIGSVITVTLEGTRPMLVEVQALTSQTPFGYPRRTANGFDINRLHLLIAVLQKYAKADLANQDVFVNIVGGITVDEPAVDLAVLLAIISSLNKKPLPLNLCAVGEVGLSGELRSVRQLEKRVKEAEKLGFTKIVMPIVKEKIKTSTELISVKNISETLKLF